MNSQQPYSGSTQTVSSQPINPHPSSGPHLGLHPFLAVLMVAIDNMLCAIEVVSLESLFVLCLFVAAALFPVAVLIQRHAGKDSWGLSVAKAGAVCLLTALPTSLPSFLIGAWGIAGFIGMRERASHDTDNQRQN